MRRKRKKKRTGSARTGTVVLVDYCNIDFNRLITVRVIIGHGDRRQSPSQHFPSVYHTKLFFS